MTKDYDVIVIGSGSALYVVEEALKHGLKTALVDKGPVGGTCLNNGCIPSKRIIYPADVIETIKSAEKFGIVAKIESVDFEKIMEETKNSVGEESKEIEKSLKSSKELSFYKGEGKFVSDYTIEVNGETIHGKKIFIAAGARPYIPKIKGLEKIDYLTNENIFSMKKSPKSIAMIGGGYISCEFAHFFSSYGSKAYIIQHGSRILEREEPEVSNAIKKSLVAEVLLNSEVIEIKKEKDGIHLLIDESGKKKEITVDEVLVAAGRASNADILQVEKTSVKTNEKGFISANSLLETSKKNIWAFGDIIGKEMFRHSANVEAGIAVENGLHENSVPMDYAVIPHAVFTSPEIASVGLTEKRARDEGFDVAIGFSKFSSIAKGIAMKDNSSFAKAVIDRKTEKILGFSIYGPQASILIQEIILAMKSGLTRRDIFSAIHIHPALSEIILNTLSNIQHEHKH